MYFRRCTYFTMAMDWNAVNKRLPHEKGEEGKKRRKVGRSEYGFKGTVSPDVLRYC
jgi:hypothetical protein